MQHLLLGRRQGARHKQAHRKDKQGRPQSDGKSLASHGSYSFSTELPRRTWLMLHWGRSSPDSPGQRDSPTLTDRVLWAMPSEGANGRYSPPARETVSDGGHLAAYRN